MGGVFSEVLCLKMAKVTEGTLRTWILPRWIEAFGRIEDKVEGCLWAN